MSWRKQAVHHLVFSASQRRALAWVLVSLVVVCAVVYVRRPVYVSDPPPAQGARWSDLADKIDPNTADWSELAALPAIGEKRAKAIVAYRETACARNPSEVAFATPNDLLRVPGLGTVLVAQMRPYLEFSTTRPSH